MAKSITLAKCEELQHLFETSSDEITVLQSASIWATDIVTAACSDSRTESRFPLFNCRFAPERVWSTGSLRSLRFSTQPRTAFGRRELLFHPHSEQDLINQVIAILLRQRREAKQEPVIHGRENCIDQ